MARNLTSGMLAQTTAAQVSPILLVSIVFASSTQYLWTGVGDLLWNGQTWRGVGDLGKISNISETGGVQADGMSLSLNGIAPDILADSLSEIRVGRPVLVYLGFLDTSGNVVPTPYVLYRGLVDQPKTSCGVTDATVSIAVENRLNDMGRNSSLRLDSETQRRKYPNDAGLDFIPQLVESAWAWK